MACVASASGCRKRLREVVFAFFVTLEPRQPWFTMGEGRVLCGLSEETRTGEHAARRGWLCIRGPEQSSRTRAIRRHVRLFFFCSTSDNTSYSRARSRAPNGVAPSRCVKPVLRTTKLSPVASLVNRTLALTHVQKFVNQTIAPSPPPPPPPSPLPRRVRVG